MRNLRIRFMTAFVSSGILVVPALADEFSKEVSATKRNFQDLTFTSGDITYNLVPIIGIFLLLYLLRIAFLLEGDFADGSSGYGTSLDTSGYGATSGYGSASPSTGYNAPSAGYNALSSGYGAPSGTPGGISGVYNAPSAGLGAISIGYNAPSGNLGGVSGGYNTPSAGLGAISSGYNVPGPTGHSGYNRVDKLAQSLVFQDKSANLPAKNLIQAEPNFESLVGSGDNQGIVGSFSRNELLQLALADLFSDDEAENPYLQKSFKKRKKKK